MAPRKKEAAHKFTVPGSFEVLPHRSREPHTYEELGIRLDRLSVVVGSMKDCEHAVESNKVSLALSRIDAVDDIVRNLLDTMRQRVENAGGSTEKFDVLCGMANLDEPVEYVAPMNATPQAAAVIRERELDISQIDGSGPGGKVTYPDVHKYLTARSQEGGGDGGDDGADGGGS